MNRLGNWVLGLVGRKPRREEILRATRGAATHVIILDGTMSSLEEGQETNAGLTFKLLKDSAGAGNITLYYEAGIQWSDWQGTYGVMTGKGLNRQIQRAYGVLASRYHVGDRIILIGYSRGAYAVRSLAGVVDRVGLLRAEHATERNITQTYRHYRLGRRTETTDKFRNLFCHDAVEIEAVAVWDTVKALGLRLPIIWRWAETRHNFHNHALGAQVRHGFHALAIDETREAYAPVMWDADEGHHGTLLQVWFKGSHGDIGGQLGGVQRARSLGNIPLVWMLEQLEGCGLHLPANWRSRFFCNPAAPSIGTWQGWSKLFLSRRRRIVGRNDTEYLHYTASGHKLGAGLPIWKPAPVVPAVKRRSEAAPSE